MDHNMVVVEDIITHVCINTIMYLNKYRFFLYIICNNTI